MSFTHLHLHTEYSLLDGANRIHELPAYLKSLGMDSCAITDHGALYGTLDFYETLRKEGIKPILGCEMYVAPRRYTEREGRLDRDPFHLILLAENLEGWQNLMWLSSEAFLNGFYYRPRIDFDLLREHHRGLICLSACLGGEVPQLILNGRYDDAKAKALQYAQLFGPEHYYLEVQANGLAEQETVNAALVRLSGETGIPLVATNDCHYMRREDAFSHDVLLCVQTRKKLDDEDRMRMQSNEFYVKSPAEMAQAFADLPEAVANTGRIAARCNVELDLKSPFSLPEFSTPEGETTSDFLERIARDGLRARLAAREGDRPESEYLERLGLELEVIRDMGYDNYFLIVWDFIRFAREQNIFVGPGRGSGAGSLVAYALGITNIDPLKYNLLFERFLNPERVSMPDFDIDFCIERRGEVIDYVTQKYGEDHVAQVITFGTLAARAVIRDVARVLDVPITTVNRICKMVPAMPLNTTLDQALMINPDLKTVYDDDQQVRQIIDLGRRFEGMPRHASTHAAGVVITGRPIAELAPLARNNDIVVVQYAKNSLEALGLMKFDFLGLRTLTMLREAADLVLENHGVTVDFDALTFDDQAIYRMIGEGQTEGVFQLESAGMTRFMKELKPQHFEDIIAGISLFRPGPMEQIPKFVRGRHDPRTITYDHPTLEPVLNMTYGCLVYQEQVMQLVRDLAGFSLGQSDIVRRAMSQKSKDTFTELEKVFLYGGELEGKEVPGTLSRGVEEKVARKIFNDIYAFAGYAFNKSHAAAYAVVAYYTAWLKYYYPVEFWTAMINSFANESGKGNDREKVGHYIRLLRRIGIKVLPPDVNRSQVRFATEGKAIRFGLIGILNIGAAPAEEVVREREKGPYTGFGDFVRRLVARNVNRNVFENLARSSALDGFGVARSKLIAACSTFVPQVIRESREQMENQLSFFETAETPLLDGEPSYPALEELSATRRLLDEKSMLGVYFSGHPLDRFQAEIETLVTLEAYRLNSDPTAYGDEDPDLTEDEGDVEDGELAVMAGMIVDKRRQNTKDGKVMAIVNLEDMTGTFEAVFFSKLYERVGDLLVEDTPLLLAGRLALREGHFNLQVEQVALLMPTMKKLPGDFQSFSRRLNQQEKNRAVKVYPVPQPLPAPDPEPEPLPSPTLPAGRGLAIRWLGATDQESMAPLFAMIRYFKGPLPVFLYLVQEKRIMGLSRAQYGVTADPLELGEFAARYGGDNVGLL